MVEGAKHYDRSLQVNPQLAGSWNGIVGRGRSPHQPVVERLKATLAQKWLNDQERMALHFALARC